MKKLFILFLLFSAAACSKVANNKIVAKPFFSSPEQVAAIATNTLAKNHPDEHFQSVDRISYMQSAEYDYAFVFYSTNLKSRSLVVKKNRGLPVSNNGSVTSCWGDCDCRVKATIGSDGSIDVGCTCPTCKVVTSNVSLESE